MYVLQNDNNYNSYNDTFTYCGGDRLNSQLLANYTGKK